jgi:ribose/xylose/arabinose/galactoside ABC-type transport system permease subunit
MISGFVVTKFDLPSFIVTLAMQSVFRGVTYLITNMRPISNLPPAFVFLGQGYVGIVPVNIIIMAINVSIIYIVVNKIRIGRYAVATGSNIEATRVCGVNIMKTRLFIFAVGGFCAAIGSVVLTARTASAQIAAGDNLVFDAITSVVVGGTSMAGGSANVIGTVFGCMVVGIVNNGLNLLSVNANWQIVAKGLMIMFAVLLDTLTTRYYENRSRKQVLI